MSVLDQINNLSFDTIVASNPRTNRERGINYQDQIEGLLGRDPRRNVNPRGTTRPRRPDEVFENSLIPKAPETMEDFLRLRYEQELFEHQFRGAEKTPFMRGYEEKYLTKMVLSLVYLVG